ncbi:hypothetical protein C0995_010986, partial [Termitomyces sp. Mi166
MAPKISLLNVSPDACLLERELATQKFIVAADAVFLKAQGLAMLAPLHKMAFGLLEGLLDNWRQLNLTTIEWLRNTEVCQACINIWSLNKQVPWAADRQVSWEHAISTIEQIKLMHFEKMAIELKLSMPTVAPQPIVNPAPTPVSTTLSIQRAPSVPYIANPSSLPMCLLSELSLQEQEEVCSAASGALSPQERSSRWLVPQNKGKGKAKATEDDDNDEETAQKLRKELEDFVVPTTFDDKLLASLLPPPSEYFKGDSGLPQGAKILAILQVEELVDSDSDEEKEEDRVCVIKKIKHEHIEELTGTKRRKEIMELDDKVEIVASKIPAVGPLHPASKPIVLVPSASKFVPKLIVMLASPLAGPSTAPIASSSTPKLVAAAALSKPAPAKSVGPAVKGGSIFKDPFM